MPDLDRAGERLTLCIQQPQPQPQRMARRTFGDIPAQELLVEGERAGGEFRQQCALAGGVEVGGGQRVDAGCTTR